MTLSRFDRQISRALCLQLIAASLVVSRCLYWLMGVRFDMAPAQFYWQIMDPALVRDALWQSLFYLRAQPPGFDLFIGLISHLFPQHQTLAFTAVYLCMGLILSLCLFELLDRMRVNRFLSLAIVIVFAISPVTVLYEGWLFYEYPIAALFSISALFLHRYATHRRSLDGVLFFLSIALIGSLRVVFHVVWFWAIVALLLYSLPHWRRRTALCSVVPGILLTSVYVKSLIVFGVFAPGSDVYGGVNLASIMNLSVPHAAVEDLVARGAVSPLMLTYTGYQFERPELVDMVPVPPKTGVPILDERLKSTGYVNMDGLWMAAMGAQLHRDGVALLLHFPGAYLKTVSANLQRYFRPANENWPFDGRKHANLQVLSLPLRISRQLLSGPRNAITWLTTLISLSFGVHQLIRWVRRSFRKPIGNARELTIAFAVANIIYLSAAVILYSNADQNRYRFEISPLFTLLFGLWVSAALRRIRTPEKKLIGASVPVLSE